MCALFNKDWHSVSVASELAKCGKVPGASEREANLIRSFFLPSESSLASEVAFELSDVDAPACVVVGGGRAVAGVPRGGCQEKAVPLPCTDFGLDLTREEKIFADSLLLDVPGGNWGGLDDFEFGFLPAAPFGMDSYVGGEVDVGEFDCSFGQDDMWNLEDIVGMGSSNLPPW